MRAHPASTFTAIGLVATIGLLVGCGSSSTAPADPCSDPSVSSTVGAAADTSTVDGWIAHLAAHKGTTSLVLDDGRGNRVAHRADAPMPTASMAKLIHLAAFSSATAAGRLDPNRPIPIADWQRWYVSYNGQPIDGGAHIKALEYLHIPAKDGVPLDTSGTVTAAQLADVMIRFSDSAAPDELREIVGPEALRTVMARYRFPGTAPVFRDLYQSLIAAGQSTTTLDAAADASYAAPASAAANLIGDISTGRFGPGADVARRFLEAAGTKIDSLPLGFKGGSLPGILTEAFEARRPDGSATVGVLMARGVPAADLKADVTAGYPHQRLLAEAMTDSAMRQRLACALR